MKFAAVIAFSLILTGCAGRWGQVPYMPPSDNDKNIAKIRLIGNPVGFTISQNGEKEANVDNSKVVIFKSSTDIGLPKYQSFPDRYKETYFETKLHAGIPTSIGYYFARCGISYVFLPQANEIYEFRINFSDRSGYCILYGSRMKYDKVNDVYVEEPVERLK